MRLLRGSMVSSAACQTQGGFIMACCLPWQLQLCRSRALAGSHGASKRQAVAARASFEGDGQGPRGRLRVATRSPHVQPGCAQDE